MNVSRKRSSACCGFGRGGKKPSHRLFEDGHVDGLGDVGVNLIWILPSSFLTMYYTDSALVSASFVGTMMLICRILTDLATL